MFAMLIIIGFLCFSIASALELKASNSFLAGYGKSFAPRCWQILENYSVRCDSRLHDVFYDIPRLQEDQAKAICTSECIADLEQVREEVRRACNPAEDFIEYYGVTLPASYVLDRSIYAYKMSCRKDPVSGKFCDTLRLKWLQDGKTSRAEECSDCVLGGMETDLNSPFGYDETYEAEFRAQTSSCGKSTYTVKRPAEYTLPPATPVRTVDRAIPTPACRKQHVVTPRDSCLSLALQYSVPTWSLIKLNNLDPQCHALKPNTTLCIGESCPVHHVNPYENCDSIRANTNKTFSLGQFSLWNPYVDALCLNLHRSDSNVVCIGPQGNSTRPIKGKTNAQTTVPSITTIRNPNQGNNRIGFTVPAESMATEVWTTVRRNFPASPTASDKPLAPGSWNNCTVYRNGVEKPEFTDQVSQPIIRTDYFESSWSCNTTSNIFEVSLKQLMTWNPSLARDKATGECRLLSNYRYCTYVGDNSKLPLGNGECDPIFRKDIKPGTHPDCNCWKTVTGIEKGRFGCADLVAEFGISSKDLLDWNPWIGSKCDDGLYKGLDAKETSKYNTVCVKLKKP